MPEIINAIETACLVPPSETIEASVVIPCLNEADTVANCVSKACRALRDGGITGEVVVADNGSTDGSQAIAVAHGARVVHVAEQGYGSALMGGIAAARGRLIVMADADDSYDFADTLRFILKLREGNDLVMGCRLPSGGGQIDRDAMPFLHRWWGNPMFSFLARRWFSAPVHDIHCGMRGFTGEFYGQLDLRCTGMEFASEMIIKAALHGAKIGEIPITLHADGRKAHGAHLRTFRDGWRHLRFYLLFSPRWLFLLPGFALILLGLLGYALAIPAVRIGPATLDLNTLVFSSLFILCGYQAIFFAVFTKVFAMSEGLLPIDARMLKLFEIVNLERGLLVGGAAFMIGVVILLGAIEYWRLQGFGGLDYPLVGRWVVPAATLTALGFQTILSSFFLSILGMRRK